MKNPFHRSTHRPTGGIPVASRRLLTVAFLAIGVLIPAVGRSAATNAADQALYFRNGDSIQGRLVSIDLTNGVVWSRAGMAKPARFVATNLTEIFLTSRAAKDATNVPHRAVIQFANGDELVGNLISVGNQTVRVETSYAGKLSIPRKLVAGILPRPTNDRVIFGGIRTADDWTHGDMSAIQGITVGRWKYHNGSLVSGTASSVARNLDLPPTIRMDFDLYWHNMFSLAIALHTDSLEPISLNAREQEPDFAPFYSLWLSPTATELRVVPKTGPIRRLGSVFLRMAAGTNHAAVSIFASDQRKSVALMINHRIVKEWVDPNGWSAGGRGTRFVHQGYGHVRIANLRVTKWDGAGMAPLTIKGNPAVDVALMNDASARGGRLNGFTNGTFQFQSGESVLPIKFADTSQVNLALSGQQPAPAPTNSVRVFFNGRGRLTGKLNSWTGRQTSLTIPGLGDLTLSSDTLGRIQFPK
jgi:hypothetical protein